MPAPVRHFKNSNTPLFKKPKGKLIKIDWKEYEQEIKRIWEGKPPAKLVERWKEEGIRSNQEKYYTPGSMLSRINKIKKLVGYSSNLVAYCCKCKNLNTHFLKYKVDGATIIERYCDTCIDKII